MEERKSPPAGLTQGNSFCQRGSWHKIPGGVQDVLWGLANAGRMAPVLKKCRLHLALGTQSRFCLAGGGEERRPGEASSCQFSSPERWGSRRRARSSTGNDQERAFGGHQEESEQELFPRRADASGWRDLLLARDLCKWGCQRIPALNSKSP